MTEQSLPLVSGSLVPQLAFGLYKVPADEEGVEIISRAIKVCGVYHLMMIDDMTSLSLKQPPT